MDWLPTLWFVVIALLWCGYLFLEGFDLGVGMLIGLGRSTEKRKRLLLNTIGPVWDGNEVWLLTAGGATFAAFPHWYASLFSALYIPLTIVLVALIFRAVAIEYRGKAITAATRKAWDLALGLGSLVAAFGVGAMLALTTLGLPLNENGDRIGGAFAWLNWHAILGGVAVVAFCWIHALAFLRLKTDGAVRHEAGKLVGRWLPVAILPLVAWALLVLLDNDSGIAWAVMGLAVIALAASMISGRAGREGVSFIALGVTLLAGVAAIFTAAYPVVLPSTIDPAFDLTVANASSTAYTLKLMSIVAAFGVPMVLAYQAWSYWVFRKRLREEHIPDTHRVVSIIK
ncbi:MULTISPECIES: cytochrome d ubiquinol oxidase subunit II [Glutamicibacter]|uniref:Cytochrome bd-I ubiquinol oxidase subunit 2 apoprotein n=2 Tax=Glutamicibacter TaxID=1742989 RepID=A0ABX4MXV2_9MICC|nr:MULTISPECIES: cytochrome d ubiquinol oxidase subunit II [Glutamicibacter]KWR71381.1 cytochrome C oxidase assembly protein [Arthrobacter sp. W1]PJJ44188.1 cytochrome bd-I ubiquinol oxidase subunit 2 apoprotein [Glutamicibacter mysorens]GEC13287.1 cytochrome c oxidase assembly protein [Glutamicibacter nicotianae]